MMEMINYELTKVGIKQFDERKVKKVKVKGENKIYNLQEAKDIMSANKEL